MSGPGEFDVAVGQLRRIDSLCLQFAKAWRQGEPPKIEDYLAQADPADRPDLLRELLLEENELRELDAPGLDEYIQRFPEFASVVREVFATLATNQQDTPRALSDAFQPKLAAGMQLGPYTIIESLGSGGMGEVYRAVDSRLDRDVAIKVLPQRVSADESVLARFRREAKMVAALDHPNIVVLHDIGQQDDTRFVVMELLEGENLRERLHRSPLSWQQVVEIGRAIAEGLGAAHRRGIVHRDIKPENVFLTSAGRVKILDFGLARIEAARTGAADDRASLASGATGKGIVLGTVGYMSPEQICGLEVGPASDVFSLGCVLYELVTGRRAFHRRSAMDTQLAVLTDQPPDLAESNREIPRTLADVIHRCLNKKPEQRFASGDEVAEQLRNLQTDSGRLLAAPRPLPWAKAAAIVVGFTLMILLALMVWTRPGDAVPNGGSRWDSLAVLPFASRGLDPDADFLSDGLTISLLDRLSQIRELKVRPYSAVAVLSTAESDAATLGRQLQVNAVLSGSVQKQGDQLVIRVELVDVAENALLWAETFHRRYDNLMVVQGEIARHVATHLQLSLPVAEQVALAQHPTMDLEAYRHYILGRVQWNVRTPDSLHRALDHFTLAVTLDPNYAPAYVGQADCYINLAERGLIPSLEAYRLAVAAAESALRIDPNQAGAKVSLAMAKFEFGWDFEAAESEFTYALELNPHHATGRQWYAEFLSAMGRHDEALDQIRQAKHLDPGSPIISTIEGVILYKARRFEQAIVHYDSTLRQHPDFPRVRGYMIDAYQQLGQFESALQQWDFLLASNRELAESLRAAYHTAGAAGYWQQRLELDPQINQRFPVSSIFTAGLHAQVGQMDQAFEILQRAGQQRDAALAPNLLVNAIFDPLRDDPRFDQLLETLRLP